MLDLGGDFAVHLVALVNHAIEEGVAVTYFPVRNHQAQLQPDTAQRERGLEVVFRGVVGEGAFHDGTPQACILSGMGTITFDTHKFVKTLENAGLPEAQAEAISAAVRDAHESAEVASKADLRELELRLTIKLGALVTVAVGVVAALVKLL